MQTGMLIVCFAALIVAVVVSIRFSVNVGIVAYALAFLVGGFGLGLPANTIVGYFPVSLFFQLMVITLFYGFAVSNGTMQKIADNAVFLCRNRSALVPWVIFLVAFVLCAIGCPPPGIGAALVALSVAVLVLLLVPAVLKPVIPFFKTFTSYVSIISLSFIGALLCSALKLADEREVIRKNIPWSLLFMIAGAVSLINVMNQAGLTEFLSGMFTEGMGTVVEALLPGDLDSLTEPGHIEGDLGHCLLPNGAGYGSVFCALPEVTLDMYKWYKQLRMVDKLSYKIWYPGSHISEINGVTVEDVGFGPETFHVEPGLDWKALGFTCNPRERDPQFAGLIGGNSWIENLDPAVCLEATRRMAAHCIYERANINNFLPELYEKMKDQPLADPEFVDEGLALKE